jgi:subtilisin family serine protease
MFPLRVLLQLVMFAPGLAFLPSPARAADPVFEWRDPYFGKDWALTPTTAEVVVAFGPELAQGPESAARRAEFERLHGLVSCRPWCERHAVAVYAHSAGPAAPADPAGSTAPADPVGAAFAEDPRVRGVAAAVIDQDGFLKHYVPGELTVQFRRDLGDAVCRARIAARGATVLEDYWTPGYYRVALPADADLFAELRAWVTEPDVRFAEPLYLSYGDQLEAPDDPLYSEQWHLENPGTGPWSEDADVHAEEAWAITRGDPGVLIVIIDTGGDVAHEDLVDRVIPQNGDDWDFSGTGTLPTDLDGHGTACAGVAVATQGNGLGVSGVCPECSYLPLKVALVPGENAARADAINYAASRRADFAHVVVSCSWRMSAGDFTAVRAAIEAAWEDGVLLLAASGNGNDGEVTYPARYPEVIAVGASSPCDERKSLTSCDGENWWGSSFGPEQEVVAPGVRIATTDVSGSGGYLSGNYHPVFNGTSAACPAAAGVVGLICAAVPELDNVGIREVLRASADDQVGPPAEDTPGFDVYMGYGRVNAARALLLAQGATTFEDDVEAGGDLWSSEPVTEGWFDRWRLSERRNHTPDGTHSFRCGAPGDLPYGSRIDAALVTPPVRLSEATALRFWHWMDAAMEDGEARDGGIVEISDDGGATWRPLVPVGGYPAVLGPVEGSPLPPGTPLFSGRLDWSSAVADLGAFSGSRVQVRFRFATRALVPPGEGGEGWYVDDVSLGIEDAASLPDLASGLAPAAAFLRFEAVAPHPVHRGCTLRFELAERAEVVIEVFDVQGRLRRAVPLGSRSPGRHEFAFAADDGSGSMLPRGTYFCRITAGEHEALRSLVLLGNR